MNAEEQKLEFEKLCARAKRNGLLKAAYPDHGIAIIAVTPAQPGAPDVRPPSAAGTPEAPSS